MFRRLALASALALVCSHASADTFIDAGGTVSTGVVDVSRTGHAAVQCVLTVTSTATAMTALWATAGCPAFPNMPQFAFVGGYGVAAPYFYSTSGTPAATLTPGTPTYEVGPGGAASIEGRLSITALQLVAPSTVIIPVEVRW